MSNRVKAHFDHLNQSVFNHGLIKFIICTVLQKKNMIWDHFLFWLGFTNEQDDRVKKSLIDKQFGFVKRFEKEIIEYLVQYNIQENSQGFKESVDEDRREALEDE